MKLKVVINIHDFYFDIEVPDNYNEWDYNVIEYTIKQAFFKIIKENEKKLNIIDIDWEELKK